MMPTQSWKNLDPEDGVHGDIPEGYWQIIRENWPVYDKHLTPANTMGAVAEIFRLWPGTLRRDEFEESIRQERLLRNPSTVGITPVIVHLVGTE